MWNLLKSILPQTLMLLGIAGMAALVLRGARRSPQFWELALEAAGARGKRLAEAAERSKVYASKKAFRAAEKTLRLAKIISLRLDNFFSKKLEAIIKKRSHDVLHRDFWKKVRERRVMIKKPPAGESAIMPLDESPGSKNMTSKEEVLARFAKQDGAEEEKILPP